MEEWRCRLEVKERELDEKEKVFREMEEKLEGFGVDRKAMDELRCTLEAKESELEEWAVKLALKEREVKSKSEEVSLGEKRVLGRHKEVEMKEKDLDENKKSIEDGRKHLDELSYKLKKKEWTLHKQGKELQLESMEKFVKVHGDFDGRVLRLFMIERLKRIDLVSSKMSDVLQCSSDPAKLVLGAMLGFQKSQSNMESREIDFDSELTRRSCILLLEKLKSVSAEISPPVKEEALKLATKWRSKMTVTTENRLEILGFLLLVTT